MEILIGGRRYGKVNTILELFRLRPEDNMTILTASKDSAEMLCSTINRGYDFVRAEVVEHTHYGQPITKVWDELTDANPRIEVIPNESKSYSVKVTKD